jgi:hypothetical protein
MVGVLACLLRGIRNYPVGIAAASDETSTNGPPNTPDKVEENVSRVLEGRLEESSREEGGNGT